MPQGPHSRGDYGGHASRAVDDLQRVLIILAGLLGTLASACDVDPRFGPTPEGAWVISTTPPDGARDVPRTGRLRVELGRSLVPSSVTRATFQLGSGVLRHLSFLTLEPVTRTVFMDVTAGEPLEPDTTYRIRIADLWDLDGNLQETPVTILFTTGADFAEESDPPGGGWDRVQPLLSGRCLGSGCHGAVDPALGLDLSSPEAIHATAVGMRSRLSPAAGIGAEGARGAHTLSALPIIDVVAGVGDASRSYLIYKVLGDPHIVGEPMPPQGAPLTEVEALELSGWIRAGAPGPEQP